MIKNPVFKSRTRGDDVFKQMFGVNIEEVFMPLGSETRLVVVKTKPEGYCVVSSDGHDIVKLVNRLEFSKNNFTLEKEWN